MSYSSRKKKRKGAYVSGYCTYAPHQYPCKGEFANGAYVKPLMTLCSCECHGDYEQRMTDAGQRIVEDDDTEEQEDDE